MAMLRQASAARDETTMHSAAAAAAETAGTETAAVEAEAGAPPAADDGDEGEDDADPVMLGRGSHSSTSQLNLSRVCHKKTPYTP
jgi:hypothetical protein